nr:immunoglobulin heavy chain junction region [Macaca mulatta]
CATLIVEAIDEYFEFW